MKEQRISYVPMPSKTQVKLSQFLLVRDVSTRNVGLPSVLCLGAVRREDQGGTCIVFLLKCGGGYNVGVVDVVGLVEIRDHGKKQEGLLFIIVRDLKPEKGGFVPCSAGNSFIVDRGELSSDLVRMDFSARANLL